MHAPSTLVNGALCGSGGCLHSGAKLHSHDWRALVWRALMLEPSTHMSGALHTSTSALQSAIQSYQWSFVCEQKRPQVLSAHMSGDSRRSIITLHSCAFHSHEWSFAHEGKGPPLMQVELYACTLSWRSHEWSFVYVC